MENTKIIDSEKIVTFFEEQIKEIDKQIEDDRVKYSVGIRFPKTKKKIEIKFYLF